MFAGPWVASLRVKSCIIGGIAKIHVDSGIWLVRMSQEGIEARNATPFRCFDCSLYIFAQSASFSIERDVLRHCEEMMGVGNGETPI